MHVDKCSVCCINIMFVSENEVRKELDAEGATMTKTNGVSLDFSGVISTSAQLRSADEQGSQLPAADDANISLNPAVTETRAQQKKPRRVTFTTLATKIEPTQTNTTGFGEYNVMEFITSQKFNILDNHSNSSFDVIDQLKYEAAIGASRANSSCDSLGNKDDADAALCTSERLDTDTAVCTSERLDPDTAVCTSGHLDPDTAVCTSGRLDPDTAVCTSGHLDPDAAVCTSGRLDPDTAVCTSGRLEPDTAVCTSGCVESDGVLTSNSNRNNSDERNTKRRETPINATKKRKREHSSDSDDETVKFKRSGIGTGALSKLSLTGSCAIATGTSPRADASVAAVSTSNVNPPDLHCEQANDAVASSDVMASSDIIASSSSRANTLPISELSLFGSLSCSTVWDTETSHDVSRDRRSDVDPASASAEQPQADDALTKQPVRSDAQTDIERVHVPRKA